MPRRHLLVTVLMVMLPARLPAFTLQLDSTAFTVTPLFSEVTEFQVRVEVDVPLAPGLYDNPPLRSVTYSLHGTLAPGTRGGPGDVAVSRGLSGEAFYQQGGALRFEVAPDRYGGGALTARALAGDDVVLLFNAREIDAGEFHAPILLLRADGSGLFANADNIVSVVPLDLLEIGSEFASTLAFDPATLVLSAGTPAPVPIAGAALALCAGMLGSVGILRTRSRR